MQIFGSILGPLVGGIILMFSSFSILFCLVLLFLILAIIPLLLSKEVYVKTDYDWKYMFGNGHSKYFFAYFSQGVRAMANNVLWPIFIFAILGSYLTLGIYGTVATLVLIGYGMFIGQVSDQMSKSIIIKLSAVGEFIVWMFRIFVSSILGVFALGSLGGVTGSGVDIPLLAKSYNRAKKEKIAAFLLFRELSIRVGQLTILCIVLALGHIEAGFGLASLTALLNLLM